MTSIRLGNVSLKIGSGATPKGGKEVYLASGETTFIRSQNIYNGRFEKSGLVYLTNDQANDLSNVEVMPNDILLNITGDSVARACQVPVQILPARVNQHVAIIRTDPQKLDARFLSYFLISPFMQDRMLSLASAGATRQALTKGMIENFEIPALDMKSQQAIAVVLGALDDKIELNHQMNTTLESMVRTLFKSWFVDFDPVRAKSEGRQPFGMDAETAALFPSRLVPSALCDIPEGWGVTPIIESAEFINGAAYKNMHFSNDPDALPVIKIAELKSGISPGTQYTNTDLGNKFRLDTGDILFSWSGSPDTSIDSFIYTSGPAWLNQHIFKVVSTSKERRCFTYWLLKYLNPAFIEIARDKQTTGLGHVTRADMQRMKFAEPSKKIITAFYQKAGGLMDKIQANLSQGEYLAKTRDYLLPKLISGDIRIPDAEKFVEAA